MEELRTEEMIETVGTVAEEVTESVVKKGGFTFGKAAIVTGVVTVLVAGTCWAVKKIKNKKAKKDAEVVDAEVVDESNFEEKTE